MVRERLNAIDIAAVVSNLQKSILNYNLVNIYDVTHRVFVLKFSKNENKVYVLLEIGCRIHTTAFLRKPGHLPSNFNMKLRRHLKNRRLGNVVQMSQDRVIDFEFSTGEHAHHLIIQFFLPGNIYLTDAEYNILAVLKSNNIGEFNFKVKQVYQHPPVSIPWNKPVERSSIMAMLGLSKTCVEVIKGIFPSVHSGMIEWVLCQLELGDYKSKIMYDADVDILSKILHDIRTRIMALVESKSLIPGYLLKDSKDEFNDFSPFKISKDVEEFQDFNDALDAYFTRFEITRQEKLEAPKKPIKLSKIKLDQDRRELKLKNDIERVEAHIAVLVENYIGIDEAINLVRALLASGASWKQITDQIKHHSEMNHPVARHIVNLDILGKTMTFQNDNESVNIDFTMTCHQNLELLYADKKRMENKLARTIMGREFALKKVSSEKEAKAPAATKKKQHTITKIRKRFWFEKFNWFITSDGYLVLSGREAMQNELLVKRYMTNGDLYFHADVHGASSCILKNCTGAEVPQKSLIETGCFAACHSSAWNNKNMVPTWWVYWHQVSKTPPTGEYVPYGSFVIRGKKNFIAPQRLEMAIVIVFHMAKPLKKDNNNDEIPLHQVSNAIDNEVKFKQPCGESLEALDGSPKRVGISISTDPKVEGDSPQDQYSRGQSFQSALEFLPESETCQSVHEKLLEDDSREQDDQKVTFDMKVDAVEFQVQGSQFKRCKDRKVTAFVKSVDNVRAQLEEENLIESESNHVKFDTSDSVSNVVVESGEFKRTRLRKPTAFVKKSPPELEEDSQDELLEDHEELDDTESENDDEQQGEFSESDSIESSDSTRQEQQDSSKNSSEEEDGDDESVEPLENKLEQLKIESKSSKSKLSRHAASKLAKAIAKYGLDDEDTQELRLLLTGSKKIAPSVVQNAPTMALEKHQKSVKRVPGSTHELETLQESEIEKYMSEFSNIKRLPDPDEEILWAVPMCAPYNAVKDSPYHLKLVPGNLKKGTIASTALNHFIKQDPSKSSMIKLITTDQLTLCLIGNAKII
ncbi:bifunctional NFACT protein [Babesia duncani]|uniref:Ribosome quality control complex subunit 2 n=1 Tax=Babesia duncani TaxID=323732 RepID=A0AAD9UNR5_9APIC|nr:bifunctional NFACT protein [Babesia duncani]